MCVAKKNINTVRGTEISFQIKEERERERGGGAESVWPLDEDLQ